MKIICSIALAIIAVTSNAQDIKLSQYNWNVTDAATRGLNKDDLFDDMDRSFVRIRSSICSNRAMMWANDFKNDHRLNTAKIFLFYTKKKSRGSLKTWWYHVAPVINEKKQLWVLDPGFPGFIDEALSVNDWLEHFTDSTHCKEIKRSEKDLIKRMFISQMFPQRTSYGHNECYYIITPHTLWTPGTVAENLLGVNEMGEPVQTNISRIKKDEYYQACVEATTSKLGFALGGNKKKCEQLSNRVQ